MPPHARTEDRLRPPAAPLPAHRTETNSRAQLDAYHTVRSVTEQLASPLTDEDQAVQSMPDTSPTKWHRAHVTWFFETFLLQPHCAGYRPFDERFGYLFNSYYEQVGPRHPRPLRGLLSRPSVEAISRYRAHVDRAMTTWLNGPGWDRAVGHGRLDPALLTLGLHHEQQHQELLLMDIKHLLSCSPLEPTYSEACPAVVNATTEPAPDLRFVDGAPAGVVDIGSSGAGTGFSFDNEGPRHQVLLRPYQLGDRLVTNAEWLAFMVDGGYQRPELWLSDGWAWLRSEQITHPLYWRLDGDPTDGQGWHQFSLAGPVPLPKSEPVSHVSFFEADAYARWAGARLPTEFEWEAAALDVAVTGNLLALDPASPSGRWAPHPRTAAGGGGLRQLYGDLWEWTASPYVAYPGFAPVAGAVGEYNGKFMNGQYVLRGGSCVTPADHLRPTYRNFFPPTARWPFTGLRLAR